MEKQPIDRVRETYDELQENRRRSWWWQRWRISNHKVEAAAIVFFIAMVIAGLGLARRM